jgi:hypothetical protein
MGKYPALSIQKSILILEKMHQSFKTLLGGPAVLTKPSNTLITSSTPMLHHKQQQIKSLQSIVQGWYHKDTHYGYSGY